MTLDASAAPRPRKWASCVLKAAAGLLLLGGLLLFAYVVVLPFAATRWLERELEARTGAPAQTRVEAIGLNRTRVGPTTLSLAAGDVSFDRLFLEYTWQGLRAEHLEAVLLDGLTLRADTDDLWAVAQVWIEATLEDVEEEFVPPPPPDGPEEEVVLLPPPLPDPGWLWETPILLSALRDIPVGRATISRGLAELHRGATVASYNFDARHEQNDEAVTSRFQVDGPGVHMALSARTAQADGAGFLGFSGAFEDLLPVWTSLAPAGSPLDPARWHGKPDGWHLPLLRWDIAVETREDLLAAAGLVLETGPLHYAHQDLVVDWENAVLGLQLGPSAIEHVRLGIGPARIADSTGAFQLAPSTLHYLREDDLLEWSLPRITLQWPELATGDLSFRLAARPRYEWWTSPLDGRLVARDLVLGGQPVDDFALEFHQNGDALTAKTTRLRWEAYPRVALDGLRLEAWDPFLDIRRVLFEGTVLDALIRSPLATLQGQIETPANGHRLTFDLLGPTGEPLGGGTYRRQNDAREALQADLTAPGPLLSSWAGLVDPLAPLRELAGSIRLRLDGTRTGEAASIRGTAGITLTDVGFIWDDNVYVEGLEGGVALRWIGLAQTDEPQSLAARSIRVGDFPLEDVRLRIHWPLLHRFEIQEFSLRLLDGSARLEPLRINPLGGFRFDAVLILENIDAAAVTALFPDERYAVSGRLTGRLPVHFNNGRLFARPGFLELSAAQPARLRILGEDLLNDILAFQEIPRLPIRDRLKIALREGIPLRSLRIDLFDADRTGYPAVFRFHGSIRTPDIVADDIQLRLNYNLEGIDWREDLSWLIDLLQNPP